ncbi:MAG: sulfite exporter TauE/SafE family protein [Paracoccaceae bacterium]
MTFSEIFLFGSFVLFISGAIKGFIGIGLPTVAMVLLTLVLDARSAITLILMPMLFSNIWQMMRGEDIRLLIGRYWRFVLIIVVTVALTAWATQSMDDKVLRPALGVIVLLFVLATWRSELPDIPPNMATRLEYVFATVAGILGGLTSTWGVPVAMFLSTKKLKRDAFIQATGLLIAAGSFPLVGVYFAVGHSDSESTLLSCLLLFPTLAGYWVGEYYRKKTDPNLFKPALLFVFLCLGLNLLVGASFGR